MSTPVAILGPTGYTGLELLELLSGHPHMHAAYLASARPEPFSILREFPRLAGRLNPMTPEMCGPIDHDAIAAACRLAFLCLPHEAAMVHTPQLLSRGVKVIDLSAAYRLKDASIYEAAYGHHHTDVANLSRAVYGLPEFFRDQVHGASLVANPGCYPTAAAIALVPLLRAGMIKRDSIVINAASGASGAGREAKAHLTIVEAGDNFSAYGIGNHRHQPEIEQTLAIAGRAERTQSHAGDEPRVLFLPHLLPIERGILATITVELTDATTTTAMAQSVLNAAYARERFVTVRDDAPTLRDVQKTNGVHVNARVINGAFARSGAAARPRLVVVAAIDNLIKGASGQAIQNANLMLGCDEAAGLR